MNVAPLKNNTEQQVTLYCLEFNLELNLEFNLEFDLEFNLEFNLEYMIVRTLQGIFPKQNRNLTFTNASDNIGSCTCSFSFCHTTIIMYMQLYDKSIYVFYCYVAVVNQSVKQHFSF